jgi:predicted transcriptional regulator of viral defense system
MKRILLIKICRELAQAGIWCIPEATLITAAGHPDLNTFRVAMNRHVKAGLIERIGPKLYNNPFLQAPLFALHRLANFLRPEDTFYLSTESVLSEHGWISQMPFCLTFVTTGHSYRYTTQFGDISFVHTEENPATWEEHLTYNEVRQVWESTPEKALQDLTRYGKNLDLVIPEDERE